MYLTKSVPLQEETAHVKFDESLMRKNRDSSGCVYTVLRAFNRPVLVGEVGALTTVNKKLWSLFIIQSISMTRLYELTLCWDKSHLIRGLDGGNDSLKEVSRRNK